EVAEGGAARNPEVDAVDGDSPAEALRQAVRLDDEVHVPTLRAARAARLRRGIDSPPPRGGSFGLAGDSLPRPQVPLSRGRHSGSMDNVERLFDLSST